MKRKIRLTESELTRLIKRVISEQTTKQVTVTVDCTKKTVDGFSGITDGFFTPHCGTAKGTTTGAGTAAAGASKGTTPQTFKGTALNMIITDEQLKAAAGVTQAGTGIGSRENGNGILGPGYSMFECWNNMQQMTTKFTYEDPEYKATIWDVPAKKQALTNLYKTQCQHNFKWAKANGLA